jgi:TPR repeat protein
MLPNGTRQPGLVMPMLLYRAETICANIVNQKKALEISPDRDPDSREALQASVSAGTAVCRDVSPTQVQERLQYLGLAAKAGLAAAQINYFAEGPFGAERDFSDDNSSPNPTIEEWKKNSIGYLTQLAQQGNNTALSYLSVTYEAGEIVPRDLKLALTYEIAGVLAKNADPGNSPVVSRLEKQLSADQVSDALTAATELMRHCCANGS